MSNNVKAKKNNHKNKASNKSAIKIPVNQKHQIISLQEFGDYNYDTRRAQWHKLAGHNDEQQECVICRDDDNWATIEVDNGAHICYFCWVKKPTAETKKIVATAKKSTPKKKSNNLVIAKNIKPTTNNQKNNLKNDKEIIEISKFVDAQGISFRNSDEVQNYRTKKNTIDKTSRYGVSPAIYYDSSVNYKKPIKKICVVKSYDNYLLDASKHAENYANEQSKIAFEEYHESVLKSKLLTKKNVMAAKVNSLRTLTKAMLLEKNDVEQRNELLRHQDEIKLIHQIREEQLAKNELELPRDINNIEIRYANDLQANENWLIKKRNKIETKRLINDLKIERQREKVKTLALGQDYQKRSLHNDIAEIKANQKMSIANVNAISENEPLTAIIKKLDNIDPRKLTEKENAAVVKFLNTVDYYNKQEKLIELNQQYNSAIKDIDNKIMKQSKRDKKPKKANENEAMIVSYNTYKKIVNAKKETLTISMPINKLEQGIRVKTKTIKVDKPSKAMKPVGNSLSLVKIKPQTMKFDKIPLATASDLSKFSTKEIDRTIEKFKKIVHKTLRSSGFEVSPYGSNAYKIDYQKMTYNKYDLKYKRSWRDFFKSNKDYPTQFTTDTRYVSLEEFNKSSEPWYANLFKQKLNDHGEPVPKRLNKLRRLVETLPSDPAFIENNGLFVEEKIDLAKLISDLKAMEIDYNLSQEQVDITLKEVNRALDLYDKITSADVHYAQNIQKSQLEDEKLARDIEEYTRSAVAAYAKTDSKYNAKLQRIQERYTKNVENAQNQHLLRIEYIYEQEENSLNKENQQHLWNQSALYEGNNKIANNQYTYQNSIIDAIDKEILKFNKKNPDNVIATDDLPARISKLPVTSHENINLSVEQVNNKVLVKSNNVKKAITVASANTKLPENIKTIYVLDKYRHITDLKTRVALLTEYAKNSYESAIKYNKQREEKEIAIAKEILNSKIKIVDKIYDDAQTLKINGDRINRIVSERKRVQSDFESLKDEKWKIYDKSVQYDEKLKRLQAKEEQRQLILMQKQENLYQRKKNKILKKKNSKNQLDYHDVIETK